MAFVMTIHMDDPFPGRCKNHRAKTHGDGYVENMRCLEAEGTRHICRFPKPAHIIPEPVAYSSEQSKPKQWEVPPPSNDDWR